MPRLHGLEVLQQGGPQRADQGDHPLDAQRRALCDRGPAGRRLGLPPQRLRIQEIATALKEVLADRRYLSATLSEWAILALTSKGADQPSPGPN